MVALVYLSSLCHVTVFCGSSSCSCGLVCIVWLWYFLTMLTYFCMLNVKRKKFLHISTASVKTCVHFTFSSEIAGSAMAQW